MRRKQPLRGDPEKVRAWQQRSAERAAENARKKPRVPLPRSAPPRKARESTENPSLAASKPSGGRKTRGKGFEPSPSVPRGARCAMPGCEDRAVHFHHVVERQELKRRKGDASDARNGVFLCFRCHGDVTSASRRLTLAALPDSVFEFAWELMGPAATVYLRRYHDGEDERLDRLVELADS